MIFIPAIIAGIIFGVIAYKIGHKQNKKKERTWVITLISVIFGITVLVAGILLVTVLDPEVEVKGEMIQVTGLYKRNIALDNIEDVSLEESMPEITDQLNGLSLGNTYRGTFRIEGDALSTMFVQKNSPPYIYIVTRDRLFLLNFRDGEETEELYREILESLE